MWNSSMPGRHAVRPLWAAAALVALAGASSAAAQERRLEFGGTLGWTLSDGVRRSGGAVGTSGLFATGITPEDGLSYTLYGVYFVNENVQVGLHFGRQDSELQVTRGETELPIELGSMAIENYHAISTVLLGDDDLQFRPYFLFGLGLTHYSDVNYTGLDGAPRAFDSKTRFSPTVGGGLKFYVRSHKYGLNLAVRWTPVFLKDDSEGFWCDPYWGCFTEANSQLAHQVEFSGGVQFRF